VAWGGGVAPGGGADSVEVVADSGVLAEVRLEAAARAEAGEMRAT
jgi:hypothetical protein